MGGRSKILIYTLILYAATLAMGIRAAWLHAIRPALGALPIMELTLGNALIFAVVFIAFTTVMIKFVRVGRISLSFFLVVALLAGAQFVASPWLASPYDILAAVALVVLMRAVPLVAVHDLAIIVGIAGIAGLMGLTLTPLIAAGLLAVFSIYDIISVYRTKQMVALAGRMLQSGTVFGFLVPSRLGGFFRPVRKALKERSVMMLGSGDIGLPLVLAVSTVSVSVWAAVMVAGFALVGVMVMQWLFMNQRRPAPMAALPPIAALSILGYVAAILLGI